ncbi:MAG TPA: Uma2 family endonuclease [Bryobacteraceae bacterium]|nr:Uma2 family endonuclease [Bryobacteraceae bacterium]
MQLVSPLTIDDFEQLPDELALNHELVDGKLADVSGNTLIHNRLRDAFISLLRDYVRKNGLGEIVSEQEFDFGGNAHGPDVSFFGPDKLRLCEAQRRVQRFVPDLAIEIVSENHTFKKLVKKADRYRKFGTKEAWIIDPDSQTACLYSDTLNTILREDGAFQSSLIPGFSIRLGDLFDQL